MSKRRNITNKTGLTQISEKNRFHENIIKLNFSGPEFIFVNFGKLLRNQILKGTWVSGWCNMAPGSVRVIEPPAGLG